MGQEVNGVAQTPTFGHLYQSSQGVLMTTLLQILPVTSAHDDLH